MPSNWPPTADRQLTSGENLEPVLAEQSASIICTAAPGAVHSTVATSRPENPSKPSADAPQRAGQPDHDGEHHRKQGADRDQAAGSAVVAVLGALLDQCLVQPDDGQDDQNLVQRDRRGQLPEFRRAEQVREDG